MKKLLLVAALAASAGCMGGPEDYDRTTSSAVTVPADTEPLDVFVPTLWLATPRSCEDRIPAGAEFRLVSGDLVVALNAAGVPVCVDEVEDVQAELASTGRIAESRALGNSYLVSVGLAIPIHPGDPSPQPSTEACDGVANASSAHGQVRDTRPGDEVEEGDPSPQPSVQECRRTEMPRRF